MDEIVNRVANSGIITINLEEFYASGERVLLDIKPWLYAELILKEKEFREHIKNHAWEKYKDKLVAVHCSADAIIPVWAFMLISLSLQPYATKVFYGNLIDLESVLFEEKLNALNVDEFKEARVVIKGCGELPVPTQAYIKIAMRLKPVVKTLMYGEPCSTVPLYKAPKIG